MKRCWAQTSPTHNYICTYIQNTNAYKHTSIQCFRLCCKMMFLRSFFVLHSPFMAIYHQRWSDWDYGEIPFFWKILGKQILIYFLKLDNIWTGTKVPSLKDKEIQGAEALQAKIPILLKKSEKIHTYVFLYAELHLNRDQSSSANG